VHSASVLVAVDEFRAWAGIGANVGDDVIKGVLAEAEAGIAADVGAPIYEITADESAAVIAHGEMLRRANRLLARKNSPEGLAGAGSDGPISIPQRDPDSQRAVWSIRAILMVPEGVA
jgi:hypothetical protein